MNKSGNAEDKNDRNLRKIWYAAKQFYFEFTVTDIHFNFGFVKFRVKQKK